MIRLKLEGLSSPFKQLNTFVKIFFSLIPTIALDYELNPVTIKRTKHYNLIRWVCKKNKQNNY
jgi:hypothetical protein